MHIRSERFGVVNRSTGIMQNTELVSEIQSAAATLLRAADLVKAGDLPAAEIGISDALFRMQSIITRVNLPEGHDPSLLRPRI